MARLSGLSRHAVTHDSGIDARKPRHAQWIDRVSWGESKVFLNLSRETIKQSPEYTEESLLTRDYETGLHRHYGRHGYWVDELAAHEHAY